MLHILKILGIVTLESDYRSPTVIENDDSAIGTSGPEDILSPCNNRCGKKTLFPMVFGYQEAKSPRSPLGAVNLNTNFMVSLYKCTVKVRHNCSIGGFRF